MPYMELDDGFYDHVETQQRSHAAVGLFIRALNYCCRHLTDGCVPAETMRFLARGRGGRHALDELQKSTSAGPAWLRNDEKAFVIDRYADVTAPWGDQKLRAEVEKARARARARKAAQREKEQQQILPWSGNGGNPGKAGVTP